MIFLCLVVNVLKISLEHVIVATIIIFFHLLNVFFMFVYFSACVCDKYSEWAIYISDESAHCLTLCVLHCSKLDRHTHTHTHTRPTLVTGASRHGWVYTHLLQEDQPLVKLCECVMRSRECVCVCVQSVCRLAHREAAAASSSEPVNTRSSSLVCVSVCVCVYVCATRVTPHLHHVCMCVGP